MIIVVGLVLFLIGVVLTFRGAAAARLFMALWGAAAGWVTGAGLVASASPGSWLAGLPEWLGGLAGALLIGALAYAMYVLAIAIALGLLGMSLGVSAASWLGLPETGMLVAGLVVGLLVAVLAVVLRLPHVLLIVVTALIGAATTVGALALLTGAIDATGTPEPLGAWWGLGQLVLAVLGAIVQSRTLSPAVPPVRSRAGAAPA